MAWKSSFAHEQMGLEIESFALFEMASAFDGPMFALVCFGHGFDIEFEGEERSSWSDLRLLIQISNLSVVFSIKRNLFFH